MAKRIILLLTLLCVSPSAFAQFWWHRTLSTKADTSDANFIRPSDWNASLKPFPDSSTFISDDFWSGLTALGNIGELAWTISVAGTGVLGVIAGVANHPAIDTFSTGTTSASALILHLSSTTVGVILPTNFFDITYIVKLSQSDANTSVKAGMANSATSATPTNGIYFEKLDADNNWFGVCRASAAQTRTAAMNATGTGWVKMRVRLRDYTTDSVCFSINGGTESCLGANKPTTNLIPFVRIANSTAAAKNMYIDYFSLRVWPITR